MIATNFTSAGHIYKHSAYDVAMKCTCTLEVPARVVHEFINAASFVYMKMKDD